MFDSLTTIIAVLVSAGAVLAVAGPRLARVADDIADATGLGEAIAGSLLLGATTSLPGLITTVLAALDGRAEFAISNALGGIAAQTVFIAVADLAYRRVNLEHAAASIPNLVQAMVVIGMIGLVLTAWMGPDLGDIPVHPVSVLLVIGYVFGLRIARRARRDPMWHPEETEETDADLPSEEAPSGASTQLWLRFLGLAALVAATSSVVGAQGSNERLSLSWHPQSGNTGTVGDDAYVSIVRRESSIDFQVMATDLKPGNAYTLWFAIIADTSNCSSLPCPPPEAIADPASGVQVAFAGGAVAGADGKLSFGGRHDAGVPVKGWFEGRPFSNTTRGEVHLVINDHGPALPEFMPDMVSSYRGGCTTESLPGFFPDLAKADGKPGPNTCRLYQNAIFQ